MERNVDPMRVIDAREFPGRIAGRLEIPTNQIMRELGQRVRELKQDPDTEQRLDRLCAGGLDEIANPAWREWIREMSLWKLAEMDLARLKKARPDDPSSPVVRTAYEEDQLINDLIDRKKNA